MGPWRAVAVLVLLVAVLGYYVNGPTRVRATESIGHITDYDAYDTFTVIAGDSLVITVEGKVTPQVGLVGILRYYSSGEVTLMVSGMRQAYRITGISIRHLNRARKHEVWRYT